MNMEDYPGLSFDKSGRNPCFNDVKLYELLAYYDFSQCQLRTIFCDETVVEIRRMYVRPKKDDPSPPEKLCI